MAGRRATMVCALVTASLLAGAATAQSAERACTGAIGPETVRGDLVVPEGQVCDLAGTRVLGSVEVERDAELYTEGAGVREDIHAASGAFVQLTASTLGGSMNLMQSLGAIVDGGSVSGNVDARGTDFLDLFAPTVNGNVKVTGGQAAVFGEGLMVGGSLEATRADFFDLYDSTVNGSFSVRDMREGSLFCGNTLNGNSEFIADQTLLTIGSSTQDCEGNRVEGNVKVEGNRGDIEISGNEISGNLTCFDNSPPPTGGGNRVAGNKEGQCRAL
jgi:hypothetical protein